MTSIGATSSNTYSSTYAAILANLQKNNAGSAAAAGTSTAANGSSATNVTLSDAAKAAMATKDFAAIIADARATMDKLLAAVEELRP